MLGVFVPSGGSKWVIEAPYVMQAAHDLKVHLGWVVAAYDLGEALANLVQPFWMLPILGIFELAARDVMGYTLIVFLALVPVVLVLVTLLGATLSSPTVGFGLPAPGFRGFGLQASVQASGSGLRAQDLTQTSFYSSN